MSLTSPFALLLSQKLQLNSNRSERLEIFSLEKAFPMKLEFYIDHILEQLQMDEKSLAYCYLALEPFFNEINSKNIQKLIFTALVLVYKAFTDDPASNKSLEKIGLIKKNELKKLESHLLELIDWNFQYELNEYACRIIESFIQQDKQDLVFEDFDTNFSEMENENCSEIEEFFRI